MDRQELIDLFERFLDEEAIDRDVEYYHDYSDEGFDDKTVVKILSSNDPMQEFYYAIDSLMYDYGDPFEYDKAELEKQFNSWCEDNGYDVTYDDLYNNDICIDDYINFNIGDDWYLDQEYYCRLVIDNGDANYEFTRNPNQDNDYQIESGAGIIWLGEQLGYSVEQMQDALNGYETGYEDGKFVEHGRVENKFLDSLIQEAANAYGCPALTFLCKMSLGDLIKQKQGNLPVTVDLNDSNCGFFDGYNGGGSVLELECGVKNITIPADKIFDLVPDIRCHGMYSVDEVYGLWKGAYDDATVIDK